jgi:hypothetical protein
MTDISPENVARMLEGVTPGPWHAAGPPWNQIIYSSSENRVAFTAHSNGLDDDRDLATARFIAYAREAVPALSARLAADAKAHEKEIAIWSENYAAIERKLAKVEASNRELAMQSLADLGQAQDAWEAQKAAEAENAKLREALVDLLADDIAHVGPYAGQKVIAARAALKGEAP